VEEDNTIDEDNTIAENVKHLKIEPCVINDEELDFN